MTICRVNAADIGIKHNAITFSHTSILIKSLKIGSIAELNTSSHSSFLQTEKRTAVAGSLVNSGYMRPERVRVVKAFAGGGGVL